MCNEYEWKVIALKVNNLLPLLVSRSKLVIDTHALSLIVATINPDETRIPMNMNPVYQAVKSQNLIQTGKTNEIVSDGDSIQLVYSFSSNLDCHDHHAIQGTVSA